MATNLDLDDELVRKAVKLGKHKSKRDAVTAALENYIRVRKLEGFDELVGRVDYYEEDAKRTTGRRRKA